MDLKPRLQLALPATPAFWRGLSRVAAGLLAVGLVWGFAVLGAVQPQLRASVGDVSPRDFYAPALLEVVDTEATVRAREEARAGVPAPYYVDVEVEASVRESVNALFDDLESLVLAPIPEFIESPPPPPTDPNDGSDPAPVTLRGSVFLDLDDSGDFDEASDRPAAGVTVEVRTADRERVAVTRSDGSFSLTSSEGPHLLRLSPRAPGLPPGFIPASESFEVLVSCGEAECLVAPLILRPHLRSTTEVASTLISTYDLPPASAEVLAGLAVSDVLAQASSEQESLPILRQATLGRVNELYNQSITEAEASSVRSRQRTNPPLVFLPGASSQNQEASLASGEIVARFFQPSYLVDLPGWEQAREEAAAAVEDVAVTYAPDQLIVSEGSRLTQLHLDAIALASSHQAPQSDPLATLSLSVLLAFSLGLFIWKIRPEVWSRPRRLWLASTLVGLFAGSVLLTLRFAPGGEWFMIPATAFGFMSVVLFDARTAGLLAISYAFIATLMTGSAPASGFVLLAALIPAPLVNSASTRAHFRTASVAASAVTSLLAAGLAWFYSYSSEVSASLLGEAAAWALLVSLLGSLAGLAALQFLEVAFDVTTTLRLLDLTDRNHKALLLLQEKAFGTFNHSLMVGTLAHAAARAVGANALLARAMAYYHDLGKTQNPIYFIENQVGSQNPHDHIPPSASVEIIRRHVTDGLVIAKKFGIPSDVAEGIRCHHGDSVIRFFYGKASEIAAAEGNPPPDINAFRHAGRKPHSVEAAIVMLADAVEAASRATFASADPTPKAVAELVDRIVDEKAADGQLSECPITLEQLTRIREAFCDALAGHYHQRVAYPNFPGSKS